MSIPILMYHQIDAPPARGTPLRGLTVSPSAFAWQMRLLRLMGYRGLSMAQLTPYLHLDQPSKVVGITFDDGYQNNFLNALPILEKNKFTATCYIVSAQLGGTNIWDHGVLAAKPLMSITECKGWLSAGMEIGSHTRSHAKLTGVSLAEAAHEITASRAELEAAFHTVVRSFCYPYGAYRSEHEEMVRAAGYDSATTTVRGKAKPSDSMLALPRIMVARATNPIQFVRKVATRYEDRRA